MLQGVRPRQPTPREITHACRATTPCSRGPSNVIWLTYGGGVHLCIGIALHTPRAPGGTMNPPDVQVCLSHFQGVHTMNPSQCAQPDQLFGACMHAGGWPKLGWAAQDAVEEELTCYDEHDIWV